MRLTFLNTAWGGLMEKDGKKRRMRAVGISFLKPVLFFHRRMVLKLLALMSF